LDAKTGASIFQLPTGTPVFSSLAIARGILYYGNFSGKLTALDLTTQKPIWVFESEASKENAPAITNADGSCNFEKIFFFAESFLRRYGRRRREIAQHWVIPVVTGGR
jgi:outer membrane protein assembly factor BamB